MKIAEKLLCFVFVLIGVCFSSCNDNDKLTKEQKLNKYVTHWIYNEMDTYYLWRTHLPKKPNYNLNPKDFFNSICYWYDKNTNPDGDRFSVILENYDELMDMLSGISYDEIGFEFYLYQISDEDVIGEIQYVKKNTPAQRAELRRGQFFSKINGVSLNISNYYDLLINLKGSYTITLHDVTLEDGVLSPLNSIEKSLNTVSNYAENPIFLDTIYTISDKNIGYLVYNFFAGGPNDESMQYDIELANVISKLQQNGVDNMIVDLRYNSGGSMLSSAYLASMLVKNRSARNVFLKAEYNDILTQLFLYYEGEDAFYSYFTDTITSAHPLPTIGDGLKKLVFLTGPNTASASEMVINGLKPYNDITLLGDITIGKNVGSIPIPDEENANNKWGILPIIAKFYNSQNKSDFTAGFVPDILDQDDYYPKYNLGDTRESLLKKAIEHITGRPLFSLKSSGIEPKRASMRPVDSSISKKVWTNKIIMPNIFTN